MVVCRHSFGSRLRAIVPGSLLSCWSTSSSTIAAFRLVLLPVAVVLLSDVDDDEGGSLAAVVLSFR